MPRRREWYKINEIDLGQLKRTEAGTEFVVPRVVSPARNNISIKRGNQFVKPTGIYVAREVPLSPYTIHIEEIAGYTISTSLLPTVRIGVLMGKNQEIQYKQTNGMYDPGLLGYFGYGTPDNPYTAEDEYNGKHYTSYWDIQGATSQQSPRTSANLIIRHVEFPLFIGLQTSNETGSGSIGTMIGVRSLKTTGKQFAYLGKNSAQHGRIGMTSTTEFKCYLQLYRKAPKSNEVYICSFLPEMNTDRFDNKFSTFTI